MSKEDVRCSPCQGTGQVREKRNLTDGSRVEVQTTCRSCGGRGTSK